MDQVELERVRTELESFAAEVFVPLARSDQRSTGLTYLRGLMLDGARKSMQPMAERLGTDHQRLQQFLTSSTWDYAAVRRRLAGKAATVVDPDVWIVDDTGFPKDGKASPGVARQYSGTLGKVANCQIAVSVHAATEKASAVLDWRLFLPVSWDETTLPDENGQVTNPYLGRRRDEDTTLGVAGEPKVTLRKPPPTREQIVARRTASKIPDEARYAPKWRLVLDMLDELATWGQAPPVLIADAGYGQVAAFRQHLTARHIPYVVAVTATTTAHPGQAEPVEVAYAGRRRQTTHAPLLGSGPHPEGPRHHRRTHWRAARPVARGRPLRPRQASLDERMVHRHQDPARRPQREARRRRDLPRGLAAHPVARSRGQRAIRLLALEPAPRHPTGRPRQDREGPLAHRTRLPRTQDSPRPGPLRRPILGRLAPPRHPRHRRPPLRHHQAPHPTRPGKSTGAEPNLTSYAIVRELQYLLATWLGYCPTCHQPVPP